MACNEGGCKGDSSQLNADTRDRGEGGGGWGVGGLRLSAIRAPSEGGLIALPRLGREMV